jgi:hypothetical protein
MIQGFGKCFNGIVVQSEVRPFSFRQPAVFLVRYFAYHTKRRGGTIAWGFRHVQGGPPRGVENSCSMDAIANSMKNIVAIVVMG